METDRAFEAHPEQREYLQRIFDAIELTIPLERSEELLDLAAFTAELERRFAEGARDHGQRSFERPVVEILDEVSQELVDVPGWLFFAARLGLRDEAMALGVEAFAFWRKVQALKQRVEEMS